MTTNESSRRAKELLSRAAIVPVVTIERVSDAVPLARALVKGGLRAIEITLRTEIAFDAARAIIADVPDAVVGIGTVLTARDLEEVHDIGADFAVSPGQSDELLRTAAADNLAYVPGVQTASDLMACVANGFDTVKFFPAASAGGLATINALSGPFPSVCFCPTGGIREIDVPEWLAHPKIIALGGSWIASTTDINAKDWKEIEKRASRAATLKETAKRNFVL
jgi:2-dehydro-3-deoxyphosphogluconate aldolase/(4S)-4-hydroxy-2-oxoglutarate aldolase